MEQPIKLNTHGTATWLLPRDQGFILNQGSSRIKLDNDEIGRLYKVLTQLLQEPQLNNSRQYR